MDGEVTAARVASLNTIPDTPVAVQVVRQLRCGVHTIQGRRPTQEDSHVVSLHGARTGPPPRVGSMASLATADDDDSAAPGGPAREFQSAPSPFDMVAIFDGHGGPRAAEFAARRVPALLRGYAHLPAADAMRRALLETEREFLAEAQARQLLDGTTACVVLVRDGALVHGNVGDSEAVLCRRPARVPAADSDSDDAAMALSSPRPGAPLALALSEVHNPQRNAAEAERIRAMGGRLWAQRLCHPVLAPQICSIAVSRSLGDSIFKVKGVPRGARAALTPAQDASFTQGRPAALIADPAILERPLEGDDLFVILACDGVWDVLSHTTACASVLAALQSSNSPQQAAEDLVAEAYAKGSNDNISAIVLTFHQDFSKVDI